MEIIEIFKGFQGEGITQGKNSLFIRFPYCNLSCKYCDSKYTWKKENIKFYDDLKVFELVEKTNNIIFTGGEPLLKNNIQHIKNIITKYPNKTYEIETNGTIELDTEFLDIIKRNKKIIFNISPKENFIQNKIGSNLCPVLINQFNDSKYNNYIVKLLFENNNDFDYIKSLIDNKKFIKSKVYLQPKAIIENQIKKLIKKYYNKIIDLDLNISFRSHIFIFGKKKGV
jgi:organic radical activating enzyme